jgi:hypothetical protein
VSSALRLTAHAAVRITQRGIALNDLDLITWLGTEVDGGYLVREKDFAELDRELKHFRQRVKRLVGKRLVIDGNRVVTGYHLVPENERRLLRRIRR